MREPAPVIAPEERRDERARCREGKRNTKEVNERVSERREGVKHNAKDRALGTGSRSGAGRSVL